MNPPLFSHSAVPRIQLNKGNTITLQVSVYGFETGKPVEIFGEASQINGVVAPFYRVEPMPEPDEGEETATITLDQIPIIASGKSDTFDTTLPITVVARAAEAWITILNLGKFQSAATSIGSGEFEAGWEEDEDTVGPAVSPNP
jgi:hypothetical protein